jgi:hypothetical protein
MSVYESIMQGLTEAVDYQHGEILAQKTKLTIKPVDVFNNDDIKRILNTDPAGLIDEIFQIDMTVRENQSGKNQGTANGNNGNSGKG